MFVRWETVGEWRFSGNSVVGVWWVSSGPYSGGGRVTMRTAVIWWPLLLLVCLLSIHLIVGEKKCLRFSLEKQRENLATKG